MVSDYLSTKVKIRITTADIQNTLNLFMSRKIILHDVEITDQFTFCTSVSLKDFRKIIKFPFKNGEKIKIIHYTLYQAVWGYVKKRPFLITSFVALLLCQLIFPHRVLFWNVKGNNQISDREIVETVQDCGVHWGMSRRKINSEQIKNAMLQRLPNLRWVGITSQGAVTTINVKETVSQEENLPEVSGVSSLVAERDGIIEDYTVICGTPLFKTGDTVHRGQILISGYTDCGKIIRGENAKGEVYARTSRNMTVVFPDAETYRDNSRKKSNSIKILLGKKLIKFTNDSGIIGTKCVKMSKVYPLKLPGGFILPAAVVYDSVLEYNTSDVIHTQQLNPAWMKEQGKSYLQNHMIAGRILSEQTDIFRIPDAYQMNGVYSCKEMIGKAKSEEIVK